MRKRVVFLLPILCLSILWIAHAQNLQEQLKDFEVGDHWIYNDFQAAVTKAKSEGKPLFVLFR